MQFSTSFADQYEGARTASALAYTDEEIVEAIERALTEAEQESLFDENPAPPVPQFAEGSQPLPVQRTADFDAIEEAFFADGEELCAQHQAEALALREAAVTVRAPWWRRLFSRRSHAFAY
jgi:hypothetical protein